MAVGLVELTPGPNMAYLGLVAARHGRVAGLATVAGVTLGLALYLLATVVGLAGIAAQAPWLFQALRVAGIGYLLWLALDAWRGSPEVATGLADARSSYGRLAVRGFLANLLNPKAAIFYLALLPGFTTPDAGETTPQVLVLGAVHLGVSLVVHLGIVALAGSAALSLPRGGAYERAMRGVFAGGLVGVAAWLGWTTRVGI